MKSLTSIILSLFMITLLAGCKTGSTSGLSPLDLYQQRAEAITGGGGYAVTGIGVSRNVERALDISKKRTSQKIAALAGARLESLEREFEVEIGSENIDRFNILFDTASQTIVNKHLKNITLKDSTFETKDGITSAYSLAELTPQIIIDAFNDQLSTQRHLYTRFRASQAFANLNKQAQQYEAWKKKNDSSIK